jgi:hypothetical protein
MTSIRAMTACDCGCGRKNRFVVGIGERSISIDKPDMVRALIDEMEEGFKILWPSWKPVLSPGQAELRERHGTPEEFAKAVWAACDTLNCTTDEAEAAIGNYRIEWARAGAATASSSQTRETTREDNQAEDPQDQVPQH